jgi:hypothetical protein
MARLRKLLRLYKLGMVPAPLTAEETKRREAAQKRLVERCKRQRRLSLTPSIISWLWQDPEELRQIARNAGARLIQERNKNTRERELHPG